MRVVTFQSVLYGLADRVGLDRDPDGTGYNVNDPDARKFTEYINTAYKIAWEYWPWPDSITVEERTVDSAQLIAEDQSGETFIGEMLGVYKRDPRKKSNPGKQSHTAWQGGWYVETANASASLWCVYRPAINYFTSENYVAATAYVVGNTTYYSTSGDCYRCILDSTGNLPTDETYWAKIPFMASLRDATISGAHSEVLAEDGQFSASILPDKRMEGFLNHEVDLLDQQGQSLEFVTLVRGAPHG